MRKLKQGDIIIHDGGKRKILGVCGEMVFMSEEGDYETHCSCTRCPSTQKTLKDFGYQIDEPDWKPEIGGDYFVPDLGEEKLYYQYTNTCNPVDNRFIENKIAFETMEEAIAKAKAMLNIK